MKNRMLFLQLFFFIKDYNFLNDVQCEVSKVKTKVKRKFLVKITHHCSSVNSVCLETATTFIKIQKCNLIFKNFLSS